MYNMYCSIIYSLYSAKKIALHYYYFFCFISVHQIRVMQKNSVLSIYAALSDFSVYGKC